LAIRLYVTAEDPAQAIIAYVLRTAPFCPSRRPGTNRGPSFRPVFGT
jgi:hypothetical protein